jgi:hypothetical protein
MKTKLLSAVLAAVSIATGLPSVAKATLADDSAAIISGSFSISRTTSPKFFAHIDYAVYSPGEYPGSQTFPEDKYVYCYQLFNDSTSTSIINSLIINLDTTSIAYNPYYDTASGSGVSGGITSLTPNTTIDAITYNFGTRSAITANNHSVVLLFTSDFAPDSIMSTELLGTASGSFSIQIPVPTPEPASLFLLALASPFLLKTRRYKQS